MRTDEKAYSEYLENKYLPGRSLYLSWIFYPKIFRLFASADSIVDLGCGTGEFLKYCRKKKHEAIGVDSNESLARTCRAQGLNVVIDSVCELRSLGQKQFKYAVCDNVLEHLGMEDLKKFFDRIETLLLPGGRLVCIVPGAKGFQKDPTHKTYITRELLAGLLENNALRIGKFYYHPLNLPGLHKFFYLNMQVFEIEKV